MAYFLSAYFVYTLLMFKLFRKIAGHAVQKISSDPAARQQASRIARKTADEIKTIARSDNKAYEAGRRIRQNLDKLKRKE